MVYQANFINDLIPFLLQPYMTFLMRFGRGAYLSSEQQAYIKLTKPGSYHPISLLNVNSKILTKIIAARLATILPTMIHPAIAGFVKGLSTSSNIRKVLAILEYAKNHPSKDITIITLALHNPSHITLYLGSEISQIPSL